MINAATLKVGDELISTNERGLYRGVVNSITPSSVYVNWYLVDSGNFLKTNPWRYNVDYNFKYYYTMRLCFEEEAEWE